jgi:hypothetical protein
MTEKKGVPNFLRELEPKFGCGEALRIYGIHRIYGIAAFLNFSSCLIFFQILTPCVTAMAKFEKFGAFL